MVVVQQKTQVLYWESVPSPLGDCSVIATKAGVCWAGTPGTPIDKGVSWAKLRFASEHVVHGCEIAPLQLAVEEMQRYLAGERVQFTCPLNLQGTPFQVSVWQALFRIPYGEKRSYGEIAHAIGKPTASRAVGAANGANPVAIIVPCHRVIGSNNTLTGYGGGLTTKAWLLSLEGITYKPG